MSGEQAAEAGIQGLPQGRQSIMAAARAALDCHQQHCPGNFEIFIGRIKDFDMSDSGEVDVYVHTGLVYLFVHCPSGIHEMTARQLEYAMQATLRQIFGAGSVYMFHFEGSRDRPFRNDYGCHTKWNKQPECQVVVSDRFRGPNGVPIIVIEVAVSRETLFHLGCEGTLWLRSGVAYVILVKVFLDTNEVFIVLVKRENRRRRERRGESIRPGQCINMSDNDMRAKTPEWLEWFFNFHIVKLIKWKLGDPTKVHLEMVMEELIRGTLINNPGTARFALDLEALMVLFGEYMTK